ncbi:MAG: hypothetical protein Q7T82_10470 [Armatimonadota bacterium]|nr:hypothetical protein [Armatimonadota bacterium]
MRTVYERRSYVPPWAWVAMALGALLVILIVWLVAASNRPIPEEQYGTQPAPSPTAPAPEVAPSAPVTPEVTPPAPSAPVEKPVRVYIYERPQAAPRVIAVPQGAKEPQRSKGYESVDLPGQFTLSGRDWQAAAGALITDETLLLKDNGMRVEGHVVYVADNDDKPFDALYIETASGSGKYIKYVLIR